jgi:hypothetical protein
MRHEQRGVDVRAHRLVEVLGKGLAVDIGAQVLGIGDGAGRGAKVVPEGRGHVLSALVRIDRELVRRLVEEAAVFERGDVCAEEVIARPAVAERSVFAEAALGVIEQPHGQVGGAAQRQVALLADGQALGSGVRVGRLRQADLRDQQAALPLSRVDGMRHVRQEDHRDAEQAKGRDAGMGLAVAEDDLVGGDLPVGPRHQAARHRAVVHDVILRAGLDHLAALEQERVGVGIGCAR